MFYVLDETNSRNEDAKKSYPKIGPAQDPKKDQIRRGPGGAKFPDSAAAKICVLFNTNPVENLTISGPSRPRAHLVGFRGVRDGTSGESPGETSKTINDTIQEHSFITSLFCLVVFGSLSSRSSS